VALGAEVVDLVGLELVDELHEPARLRQVAVVHEQLHAALVRIAVEMVDPVGVEARRAADDPVDLVALLEQLLGEVRPVLAADPRDHRLLHARQTLAPGPGARTRIFVTWNDMPRCTRSARSVWGGRAQTATSIASVPPGSSERRARSSGERSV
jgi:hypothetical protein